MVLGHFMWVPLSLSVFLFSLVLSHLNLKGRKSRNDARTLQPDPPLPPHHIRHCADKQTLLEFVTYISAMQHINSLAPGVYRTSPSANFY